MKTVYKSKVDKGLLIAIIAIVLLSYLPLLFEFSWIVLALLVVTAAFDVQRAVVYGVARVTERVGNESGRDDQ